MSEEGGKVSKDLTGLVIRLRALVRRAAPLLKARRGWTDAEVRELCDHIKAHIDATDEPTLRACCTWLSSIMPRVPEGKGVLPVLSLAFELKQSAKRAALGR